jgi:hypothetical protein
MLRLRYCPKRFISTENNIFTIPEQATSLIQEQSIRTNFDSSRFVKLLQDEGFSQPEAEGLVLLISEVVDESLSSITKSLVTKNEQSKFIQECNRELQRIRSEINTIENQDFGFLKTKLDTIKTNVEASKQNTKDGISKLQAGIRLDINLEKSRMQVEMGELKAELLHAESKIDLQMQKLEKRVANIKENTRKGVSSISDSCRVFVRIALYSGRIQGNCQHFRV